MTEIIAGRPITFHCFIRRITSDLVPEGTESDWLRTLYQEKDKRFELLLKNNSLENYTPQFPPNANIVKEQKLDVPKGSTCKFYSSV